MILSYDFYNKNPPVCDAFSSHAGGLVILFGVINFSLMSSSDMVCLFVEVSMIVPSVMIQIMLSVRRIFML